MKHISPFELQALLNDDVDIVDVRAPDEWRTGHVPGARLVPLDVLRGDPRGALPKDRVVLVCAKGGRSATAAQLADALGHREVYSLNGGTDGWRAAGLPIVVPSSSPSAATPSEPASPIADEPALDAVVGVNLKRERLARGWSLDDLAREAGISRTSLGQLELGKAPPSIAAVWKLAQTLGVPFSALLAPSSAGAPRPGTTVTTRAQAPMLSSADGRFTSRALHRRGDPHAAEFYELTLAPHSREDADAHRPGTRENLIVTAGQLELKIGSERVTLREGDSIHFAADQPHSYINDAHAPCRMYLVMNYAG
jgi:rhodanese-related sulfurtransferase/transcriptional regulator with XRE-family HTH domain